MFIQVCWTKFVIFQYVTPFTAPGCSLHRLTRVCILAPYWAHSQQAGRRPHGSQKNAEIHVSNSFPVVARRWFSETFASATLFAAGVSRRGSRNCVAAVKEMILNINMEDTKVDETARLLLLVDYDEFRDKSSKDGIKVWIINLYSFRLFSNCENPRLSGLGVAVLTSGWQWRIYSMDTKMPAVKPPAIDMHFTDILHYPRQLAAIFCPPAVRRHTSENFLPTLHPE